jgi:hypothetical protein
LTGSVKALEDGDDVSGFLPLTKDDLGMASSPQAVEIDLGHTGDGVAARSELIQRLLNIKAARADALKQTADVVAVHRR